MDDDEATARRQADVDGWAEDERMAEAREEGRREERQAVVRYIRLLDQNLLLPVEGGAAAELIVHDLNNGLHWPPRPHLLAPVAAEDAVRTLLEAAEKLAQLPLVHPWIKRH